MLFSHRYILEGQELEFYKRNLRALSTKCVRAHFVFCVLPLRSAVLTLSGFNDYALSSLCVAGEAISLASPERVAALAFDCCMSGKLLALFVACVSISACREGEILLCR